MKSAKNILFLFLVWFVSVFALCLSFMFYQDETLTFQKVVGGTLLLMIYSAIFSFPAFLFFLIVSIFALKSKKLSGIQKRVIMVSANLADIFLTFGALFLLIMQDALQDKSTQQIGQLENIFAFYPLWVLVIVSSLLILVLPFNFNKTIKS